MITAIAHRGPGRAAGRVLGTAHPSNVAAALSVQGDSALPSPAMWTRAGAGRCAGVKGPWARVRRNGEAENERRGSCWAAEIAGSPVNCRRSAEQLGPKRLANA